MEHGTVVNNVRDELATKNRTMNAADTSPPPNPTPPSKRNSHHRRRSSVSTRIESAEMMGVTIPDLPPTTSDDNINLGEKDSIRRRALWALEGKPDVAFSKVEIPELSTPVMEKMMFDLATKSSQPQNTVPSYGQSINTLMANKRDSFKLLGPSSSSKDQLHTLVEEEEEEEEEGKEPEQDISMPHEVEPSSMVPTPVTPAFSITKAPPARPRPLNPNLRPLSLTPENLVSTNTGLPTPSLTPSPRLGLKALALVPSSDESTNMTTIRSAASPSPQPHRPPLTLNLASENTAFSVEDKGRRSSISYKSSAGGEGGGANYGLPTPDTATHPTFDRRQSVAFSEALRRRSSSSSSAASVDEDSFTSPSSTQSRPLSASEQHFLFKSHNALLARITDLERALSTRRMSSGTNSSSRPVSVASDSSSDYGSNGEPSDEMFRLVADLKAERDELKRDVEGWRTRVADMEKQLGVVAGRVESERRDAWVARSMSGLLEVEKGTLERKLAGVEKSLLALEVDKKTLELENAEAKQRVASLEDELERVKRELAEERRSKREAAAAANQDMLITPTPRTPEPRSRPVGFVGRRFTSVDSDATEVEESPEGSPKFNFSLKSVVEDEEEALSDEDNGLAGYEDEDESDITFQSSSSFGSEDEFARSISHLQDVPVSVTPRSVSPPVLHAPRPTHANRASISKSWTFPMGAQPLKQVVEMEPEVDRFFGCLEDDDQNSDGSVPNSPSAYSYEKSKGMFASGFKYGGNDDDAPFFFPVGAGVEVESPKILDAVQEEEDDVESMFGDAGGIQITFTPPEAEEDESFESQRTPSPSPAKPLAPTINFFDYDDEEEKSTPFNFGRPVSFAQEEVDIDAVFSSPPAPKPFSFGHPTPKPTVKKSEFTPAPLMITPPSSLPRPTSPQITSPSSIPRAKNAKPFSFVESPAPTPPRPAQSRVVSNPIDPSSAYVTPPNRRGGALPSYIPQAISSPSPLRRVSAGTKPKAAPAPSSTFVRQPQRKPLMLANNNTKSQNNALGASHGSTFAPQIPAMLNPVMNARSLLRSPDLYTTPAYSAHSEMKSVDLSDHFVINTTSISSSTTTTPSQQYPSTSQDRNVYFPSSDAPAASPADAPLVSSSSFSSMMTSPLSSRISLQSFTNFIPLSWSQRSIAPAAPIPNNTESVQKASNVLPLREAAPVTPLKRGFVSKEKQLDKLRCRLERENPVKVRTSVSISCRKCDDDDAVVL
ncbi:hypothetical protein DXG01_007448 [Tephrocybe rancida]|nr:hypothetical protein DXG01_007448 [Tephrocybe rancida]